MLPTRPGLFLTSLSRWWNSSSPHQWSSTEVRKLQEEALPKNRTRVWSAKLCRERRRGRKPPGEKVKKEEEKKTKKKKKGVWPKNRGQRRRRTKNPQGKKEKKKRLRADSCRPVP